MAALIQDTFRIPIGNRERDCVVTFEFSPSIAATINDPYIPAQIVIEKIEFVELRKTNFGHKGSKNKNAVFKLDVFDWIDHEYIGEFLNKNLDDYTRIHNGKGNNQQSLPDTGSD